VAAGPRGLREILRAARLDRHEIAGSLGDLGTFLPLLVAMSSQNGLDFSAALFFAGFFNLITGMAFAIPMAVQPMKAIAAIALTRGMSAPQIVAAGAGVSLVVLLLGVSGLMGWVNRAVPKSVVRGIQLALGLSLVMKGLELVTSTRAWLAPDSYLTALAAAVVVFASGSFRKVPAALTLFFAGLVIAVVQNPAVGTGLHLGLTLPQLQPPSWGDFVTAFPQAALPQIPLTILNSVIAVCALSVDLFPTRPAPPRRVAVSVGAMNLVGAWFGAMPMCHGAGGLAGQYRFGARTNGSVLFLGAAKMVVAVLFGASLMALCRLFPHSVLGVMLAISGVELALVCRDQRARREALPMLLTSGVCLGSDFLVGFAVGLAVALLLRLPFFRPEEVEGIVKGN
jgi:MFS superfamily sulfate permease-like transporter